MHFDDEKVAAQSLQMLSSPTYNAKGLCLVSNHPILSTLKEFLLSSTTLKSMLDIDSIETKLKDKVSCYNANTVIDNSKTKVNGKLKSKTGNGAIWANDTETVLNQVNPRNLTVLVLSIMLEIKVIIVSSISRNHVVTLIEYLMLCIKPLQYCHLYLPMVPSASSQHITDCPSPYILVKLLN